MNLEDLLQQKQELDQVFDAIQLCVQKAKEDFDIKHKTMLTALGESHKTLALQLGELNKILEKIVNS